MTHGISRRLVSVRGLVLLWKCFRMLTSIGWGGDEYPVLTQGDIRAFERRHDIILPADYAEFLLKHNGGSPVPNAFDYRKDDEQVFGQVEYFYALHTRPWAETKLSYNTDLAIIWGRYKNEDGPRMPVELMPIADDSSDQICICLSGENAGAIYMWEHESECAPEDVEDSDGEPFSWWDNCHYVAKSFTAFLDVLYDRPHVPWQE